MAEQVREKADGSFAPMEIILDGSCDLLEYYGDSPEVAGMV